MSSQTWESTGPQLLPTNILLMEQVEVLCTRVDSARPDVPHVWFGDEPQTKTTAGVKKTARIYINVLQVR